MQFGIVIIILGLIPNLYRVQFVCSILDEYDWDVTYDPLQLPPTKSSLFNPVVYPGLNRSTTVGNPCPDSALKNVMRGECQQGPTGDETWWWSTVYAGPHKYASYHIISFEFMNNCNVLTICNFECSWVSQLVQRRLDVVASMEFSTQAHQQQQSNLKLKRRMLFSL